MFPAHEMKTIAKRTALILSIIAGAAGGLIVESHPLLGALLLLGSLAGAIYSYLSSENHQDTNDLMMDLIGGLLVASGNGNPYTKLVQRKLSSPGTHHIIPILERALELDPKDADALSLYANIGALHISLRQACGVHPRKGEFPDPGRIERAIEQGFATGRNLSDFYFASGVMLDSAKECEHARQYFKRGSELSPNPYWKLAISTSYGIEGRLDESLAEMESAISEGAKGPLVDYYYGRCLAALGDFANALKLFKKVKHHRGLFYQLAVSMQEAYYFSWRPLLAAYYEARTSIIVARLSLRAAARHVKRAAHHFFLPLLVRSTQLIARCAKRVPVLRSSRISRLCDPDEPYFSLGNSLLKSGKYAAAKKLFVLASEKAPQLRNLINLCSSAIVTEDWELAEHACLRIQQMSPEHPVVSHCLGHIQRKEVMNGRVVEIQFDDI